MLAIYAVQLEFMTWKWKRPNLTSIHMCQPEYSSDVMRIRRSYIKQYLLFLAQTSNWNYNSIGITTTLIFNLTIWQLHEKCQAIMLYSLFAPFCSGICVCSVFLWLKSGTNSCDGVSFLVHCLSWHNLFLSIVHLAHWFRSVHTQLFCSILTSINLLNNFHFCPSYFTIVSILQIL